jgi:hypothetical protein
MEVPEQYIYFKNKDIAAMSLDVALTMLNEEEERTFSNKRKMRDMISAHPAFDERLQEITEKLNELGKDVSVFLAANKF